MMRWQTTVLEVLSHQFHVSGTLFMSKVLIIDFPNYVYTYNVFTNDYGCYVCNCNNLFVQ